MKQKNLHRVSLLIVLGVLLTFAGASLGMYQKFTSFMKQSVRTEATYIQNALEQWGTSYLTQEIGDLTPSRITLADTDGTVLFDSKTDPALLENHGSRPEFVRASQDGSCEMVRFSETLSKQTFYYAIKLQDGRILRISRSSGSLLFPLLLGFIFLIFLLLLILTVTFSLLHKKEAEMVRREFSANVSHELKTPLMSISGYAEIIQNGLVAEKDIPEFAGRIHHEAVRLTRLVEDIIQLSRLDEGAENLPFQQTDLYELTKEVLTQLELPAQKKRQKLTFTGEPVCIQGNPQILQEMFFNLADNAIKYTPEGGQIVITLTASPAVTWQVRDTGIGIAAEEQERIFERFYRVDKSHSRATGGTGLGLSIVKHGAAAHKAKIHLESTPGEGTCITLLFS